MTAAVRRGRGRGHQQRMGVVSGRIRRVGEHAHVRQQRPQRIHSGGGRAVALEQPPRNLSPFLPHRPPAPTPTPAIFTRVRRLDSQVLSCTMLGLRSRRTYTFMFGLRSTFVFGLHSPHTRLARQRSEQSLPAIREIGTSVSVAGLCQIELGRAQTQAVRRRIEQGL